MLRALLTLLLLAASLVASMPAVRHSKFTNRRQLLPPPPAANSVDADDYEEKTNNVIITFGGLTTDDELLDSVIAQAANDDSAVSTDFDAMPTPLKMFSSALYENKIYVLGGYMQNQTATSQFSALDLSTNTWSILPAFPVSLVGGSLLAPGDGKLYAVGNFKAEASDLEMETVFAYNVAQNSSWQNVSETPLPEDIALGGLGCGVVLDGAMYYMTEWGSAFMTKDGAKSWEQLESMTSKRLMGACVALPAEQKILVAGGGLDDIMDSVEVYDVAQNEWQELPSLKLSKPQYGMSAIMLPAAETTTVLFCGGVEKERNNVSDGIMCEKLDWQKQSWEDAYKLGDKPRGLLGLVVTSI